MPTRNGIVLAVVDMRTLSLLFLSLLFPSLLGLPGCTSPRGRGTDVSTDLAGVIGGADGAVGSDGGFTGTAFVYAHTDTMLYSVDPVTLAIASIASFKWPQGADMMTDIALDHGGNMIGISYSSIYAIDKTTAKCTFLSAFQGGSFNGLSFIANSSGSNEELVGADSNGDVYRVDPTTGLQTLIGNYGHGWASSGDLVSVEGSTYATVVGTEASDVLVKVDPTTGVATKIGLTGARSIWGLGYWKQKLFGFTSLDGMVTIDITTGKATPAPSQSGNISWFGAGVTTAAPITVN